MSEAAVSSAVPAGRSLAFGRRSLRFVLFALVGASAALGASLFHRAASKGDVVKIDLAVPAWFPPAIELDLGARAWPRRLLAGDVAAFTVRLKAEKPLAVRVAVEGDVAGASLTVDGDDHAEDRVIRLAPKRRTNLAIAFSVPAARRGTAMPAEVFLLLDEAGTGRPLGRIPLRVIDTAHGGAATAIGGDHAGHGAHAGH